MPVSKLFKVVLTITLAHKINIAGVYGIVKQKTESKGVLHWSDHINSSCWSLFLNVKPLTLKSVLKWCIVKKKKRVKFPIKNNYKCWTCLPGIIITPSLSVCTNPRLPMQSQYRIRKNKNKPHGQKRGDYDISGGNVKYFSCCNTHPCLTEASSITYKHKQRQLTDASSAPVFSFQ